MIDSVQDKSTETRIIHAARKIFTTKGLSGTRMQDIADEAQINKAMLHYYFRNKQSLFELIFKEQLTKLLSGFREILNQEINLKEKLRQLVKKEYEVLSEFPELPVFVLHEANRDPSILERSLGELPISSVLQKFTASVGESIQNNEIRYIDSRQLLINVFSLCIYPFVGKPMFQFAMKLSDQEYQKLLNTRAESLADFIWQSIKPL